MLVAITKLANLGLLIFFVVIFADNGWPDTPDEFGLLFLTVVPLLSIYTLTNTGNDQEDGLVSLWVKVRKKKLIEQLEE